jgi:hypothetical protein
LPGFTLAPLRHTSRTHNIGEGVQTRDYVFWQNTRGCHQRAISEGDAQHRRLRIADELLVLAG